MRKMPLFLVAFGMSVGTLTPAFAQGVNLDCNLPSDAMTAYCNHRNLYGKSGPGTGMANPYGVDTMATGSVGTAPQQATPMVSQSQIAACSARYRTYDPATNTFRGNDGRRHVCR